MNDRDMQADINRAEHAQRLLDDELLKEAIQAIRNEIVRGWVATQYTDEKGTRNREGMWMFAKTVDNFEMLLRGYIETGKLATANLKSFEERRGLRRVFG